MSNLGYLRVSTVDQVTDRQLAGVKLDFVYEDKCSGSTMERPKLQELLRSCRKGDVVHVHSIDRMARNVEHLLELVNVITEKGATLQFHKECMTFTGDSKNPMQQLMLNLLGAVYQFEREMLKERQREGILKAKEAGKYQGRRPSVDRTEVKKLLTEGESIRKIAKRLGIAASTVQRIKIELRA